ncbi:TPA: molecular chaperone [Klebsiella quasipneumoniae]|nr:MULTISPECIES: molecular chaperone [Klebsiella]MDE4727943.1 molecular chaperone [Klebsiella pneumoniae]MDE4738996.1 molecular chaperone [Klebsiella pneumoniae]MDE4811804.1 molecular chaperone [Klebsiella pneumoniae]MDH8258968.1 molecular chaperone [Klebsiella quasipneumoniae]SSH85563.1 putative chaperone protein EcpD [Klebsiella pneumoniae]
MKLILPLFFFFFSNFCSAGVMPSQSRVVYLENDKNNSLMLANTNNYPVIVQLWVDNGEGDPDVKNIPFVTVPPILKLDKQDVKGLKVIYNKRELRKDRETMYWLNIYEVPSDTRNDDSDSVLITMNTQIKVIFRPDSIKVSPVQAINNVICFYDKKNIVCKNQSPVYLSIVKIEDADGKKSSDKFTDMNIIANPFSEMVFSLKKNQSVPTLVSIDYMNDGGEILNHKVTVSK